MKFKVGDKVRRESLSKGVLDYNGMRVGDWDVVTHVDRFSIDLKSYGRGHDPDCFTLVKEPSPATTPHKWAKEIKAWADGAEIEYRVVTAAGGWSPWCFAGKTPSWTNNSTFEYRIKPEKKPDVVVATWIDLVVEGASMENDVQSVLDVFGRKENINCSFTFDGETGKLKAVALL